MAIFAVIGLILLIIFVCSICISIVAVNSSMNTDAVAILSTASFVILFLVFVVALLVYPENVSVNVTTGLRERAVAAGYAEYDRETGEIEWINEDVGKLVEGKSFTERQLEQNAEQE